MARLIKHSDAKRLARYDDAHRPPDQVGRQLRQWRDLAMPPSIFDRNIAALDIAGFSEPFAEAGDESCVCLTFCIDCCSGTRALRC